ncbi:MAG: hypothetical protein RIT03_349 [Bacteroidota bacterium]
MYEIDYPYCTNFAKNTNSYYFTSYKAQTKNIELILSSKFVQIMLKKIHIELKWAINFGIAFLLWMIIEKSSGLHDRRIADYTVLTNVFILIIVGIYFVALLDKKKNVYQGKMTQSQGFISGILLTLFIGLLTPFLLRISLQYISPDFFSSMQSYMVSSKKMTAEQVKLYYNYRSFLLQTLFLNFSLGILSSAIFSFTLSAKTPATHEK